MSRLPLGESLNLRWDRPEKIPPVFPRTGRPMLQVTGQSGTGKAEQADVIIPKLREVEVEMARGKTVAEAVKQIGVTEQI